MSGPLVPRARQRAAYGDRMLDAAAQVVDALHRPHDYPPGHWRRAADEALTIPQPRDEDPVHWLVAALAVQVNPSQPLEHRAGWLGDTARSAS